jgi:hypothetical protein
MPKATQQKSDLSEKLMNQVKIIESYTARMVELEAEYTAMMLRLVARGQLASHQNHK